MDHSERTRQLEFAPVGSLLWKYSVPAILGTVVNATYNITDRVFIGQTIGEIGITAATLSFPVMMIINGFGMMVGIGSTTLISIRLGEKRNRDAEKILGQSLCLFLVMFAAFLVLGLSFLEPMLNWCGATPISLPMSKEYLGVIISGLIFQHISFGVNSFLRAEGRPRIAMTTMFIAAIANIILDWFFLCVLRTGIWGAAFATVLAQAITSVWILWLYFSGRTLLKIRFEDFRLDLKVVRHVFLLGFSPFVMQIMACVLQVLQNHQLKYYGEIYGKAHGIEHGAEISIAILGILFTVFLLFLMPLLGIGQGMQPIVGYNIGAKKYDRVARVLKLSLISAFLFSLVCYLTVIIRPDWLILPFVKPDAPGREAIIALGVRALRIFSFCLPMIAIAITTTNYFQSSGRPLRALFLTLMRQVLLLIPLVLFLPYWFERQSGYYGIDGLWFAAPISDFGSFSLGVVFLFFEYRRLRSKIAQTETDCTADSR